jgi:hypothetical protein
VSTNSAIARVSRQSIRSASWARPPHCPRDPGRRARFRPLAGSPGRRR